MSVLPTWSGENDVGAEIKSGDHHHGEAAVVVLARSTQEAVVVNLESLWAAIEVPDEGPG
ncbi:MAG TPA: hypothetical protein VHV75_15905 [Solirubrobacteraceae bacterium]|jgi:hypothetical protein|nr:hypothetical protein [Solirubrobacteraceae bacterium]